MPIHLERAEGVFSAVLYTADIRSLSDPDGVSSYNSDRGRMFVFLKRCSI